MTSSSEPATTAPAIDRPPARRGGLPLAYLVVAAVLPIILLGVLSLALLSRTPEEWKRPLEGTASQS